MIACTCAFNSPPLCLCSRTQVSSDTGLRDLESCVVTKRDSFFLRDVICLITTVLEHIAVFSSLSSVSANSRQTLRTCHAFSDVTSMTHRYKLFVNSAIIGFNMSVQLFKVSRTARKIMICVNDPASASCRGTLARSPHVFMPCVRPVDISVSRCAPWPLCLRTVSQSPSSHTVP